MAFVHLDLAHAGMQCLKRSLRVFWPPSCQLDYSSKYIFSRFLRDLKHGWTKHPWLLAGAFLCVLVLVLRNPEKKSSLQGTQTKLFVDVKACKSILAAMSLNANTSFLHWKLLVTWSAGVAVDTLQLGPWMRWVLCTWTMRSMSTTCCGKRCSLQQMNCLRPTVYCSWYIHYVYFLYYITIIYI